VALANGVHKGISSGKMLRFKRSER
jgi:hypothetical protein